MNLKNLKLSRKSVSKKIFFITFSFILLLISISFIIQYFFFDSFYASKKTKNLVESVNKFRTLYSQDTNNPSMLYKALSSFEVTNNAKIAIYSTDGHIKYITDRENFNFESSRLLNTIFETLINNNDYAKRLAKSNGVYTTTFEDSHKNMKNIVCLSPMSLNKDNDSIIIAVTSYQEIHDASSAISELYIYVGIGVILLGFILSLIYSNMLSKPLKNLNHIAVKMSSMDFSEKCPVNSNDEIGNLGKTLNFLSQNLSSALKDLKLKNKKLEEDIEKERALEKLRKDFIAGVSHELKTPIGIIEGYAEGLKDNIVEGEAREFYLDVIIDESKKMNKMVMDMLELSKLESGHISLNIKPFDIKTLTEITIEKYKNKFKESNIKVNLILNLNSSLVLGEEFKIEQVITNFITNALKYTPNNENINIILKEKNSKIIFLIENTGVHIPKDSLEKIWYQFYRLDKSRSRAMGSNGLGLSIVKNILTLHNSNFGVNNSKEGVMFYFDLEKSD